MAVDEDALAKIDEVRRRVSADAFSFGAQDRVERGANASLAVRAGDMKEARRLVWCSGSGEEGRGPFEAELRASPSPREERVQGSAVGAQGEVQVAAAGLPPMCRRSWPTVDFRSLRWTTESTMPWSSRNSAVWNPSGRS